MAPGLELQPETRNKPSVLIIGAPLVVRFVNPSGVDEPLGFLLGLFWYRAVECVPVAGEVQAARGSAGSWWSSLVKRSAMSVVVNFHLNGFAVWL